MLTPWQKEDEIIDCAWEYVKPKTIKPHHVFNAVILIIVILYLFGLGMAGLIITLLEG